LFSPIRDQIQAIMATGAQDPDHLAACNVLLDATTAIEAQVGSLQDSHQQELATIKAEAQEAHTALQANYQQEQQRANEGWAKVEATTAAYKTAILAANPDVPAELIETGSVEAINASLTKAKTIVEKVRAQEAAAAASATMPTGAPARSQIDFSTMSANDKIKAGLAAH